MSFRARAEAKESELATTRRTPEQAGKKYIFFPPRAARSSRPQVTSRPLKPLVTENLQIILLSALDKYTHWVYYMSEVILWTFVN